MSKDPWAVFWKNVWFCFVSVINECCELCSERPKATQAAETCIRTGAAYWLSDSFLHECKRMNGSSLCIDV